MGGADLDNRVLVFAPIGRDGPASADLLQRVKLDALVCPDFATLTAEIAAGAAVIFIAEEGLFGKDLTPLMREHDRQPPWSDLPFIVLTSHQDQPAVIAWRQKFVRSLRNASLLERPVQPITLVSMVQSALRARRRQYEVRALIASRERVAEELERLVVERTRSLEEANQQLRIEMAERARVEEALRQSQKLEAIGQMTGGVAHDFNNLLMVISGGLEMLGRQPDPARQRRLMDGMTRAARRGAALTRQLLTFSRRQEFRPEAVDIARHVGGMRELLDRSLGGAVRVELDFPEGLWPVEVDPGQLELVVLNLAVNARDAMPGGGTITLRAENMPDLNDDQLHGDYVRLSVTDTGVGMAPEVQARAFEPFFTTKDVGKGSGLGLAQVYGFATESHGAVRIESEAGRGTSIVLLLPKSDRAPDGEKDRAGDLTGRPLEHDAGRVLLVEDDDEVAALTLAMLEQLGYDVVRMPSASAALDALGDGSRVDLVLSDVMMPGGMNGVQLAREIRKRRAELPILLTSGYAAAAASEAAAEGISLLPKPYRIGQLSAALQAVAMERQRVEG